MIQSINIHRILLTILSGLLLATIPVALFWYFALLMLLTTIFVVICVMDFFSKKTMRKSAGLMLSFMFLVAIVSLLARYSLSYFNFQ